MIDEELEIEEKNEEVNFNKSTILYRNRLIKKLSIIFVCVILIIITRIFNRYIQFDIIMTSYIFLLLLLSSILLGLGIIGYLIISRNDISKESTNKSYKRLLNIFDLLSVVPIFIAILSLSNAFFVSPATVIGQSMEPNYYEDQDILMWHLTNDYERFDVVVLKTDNEEYYIKRIIGLPGEKIIISNNQITVNGVIIEQEFLEDENGSILANTYCNNDPSLTCEFNVPADSFFVLGDNRENSLDSRSHLLGYVHKDSIYGTVIFKFNNIFRSTFN